MPPDTLTVAAAAALQAGKLTEAIRDARAAIAAVSDVGQAHAILAIAMERAGRFDEACSVVREAASEAIADAEACDALAFAATALGEYEVANQLYRGAVEIRPSEHRYWHSLGASERSFGRLEEAEQAFRQAIDLEPEHYPAYPLLSDLKVQSHASNHIDELRRRLAMPLPDRGRMFLAFALAKELDDLGEFAEASVWYREGNNVRRRNLDYDVATDVQKLARIQEVFPRERLRSPGHGCEGARFIFVMGLPRSGTTLVERMLTAHGGVGSNGETDNFSSALLACLQKGDGDIFARAASVNFGAVGREYSRLATRRASERLIVEKLPLNYLYAGPIHLALPRSKIVWVRRAPADVCFAMYRTLFGQGYPFSYDLKDLAIYFASYGRLMRHWVDSMPHRFHVVDYAALVDAPAAAARALNSHCGIGWNEAALDPTQNAKVSMTASAAQVRRPIYKSSANRWTKYTEFLQPLTDELRRLGVDLEQT